MIMAMQASANETSTLQQQEKPFNIPAGESPPLPTSKPETATESYPNSSLVGAATAATSTAAGKYTLTDEIKSKIGHLGGPLIRRKSTSDLSADSDSKPTKINAASRSGKLLLKCLKFCYFSQKQSRKFMCGQARKHPHLQTLHGQEKKQECFRIL